MSMPLDLDVIDFSRVDIIWHMGYIPMHIARSLASRVHARYG